MKKVCSPTKGCGQEKSVGEFGKNGNGYRSTCKQCRRAADKQYYTSNIEKTLLSKSKWRSEQKGLENSLSMEDIKIPEYCPVLGIKLEGGAGTGCAQPNSPSIDRLDNSKGYTRDNIRIISWRANSLKNNATPEELEKVLRYMRGDIPTNKPTGDIW